MRRWWLFFAVIYGAFVGLPFLAPVLMHSNWQSAGSRCRSKGEAD